MSAITFHGPLTIEQATYVRESLDVAVRYSQKYPEGLAWEIGRQAEQMGSQALYCILASPDQAQLWAWVQQGLMREQAASA